MSQASEFNFMQAISRQTDSMLTLTSRLIAKESKVDNFVFSPVSINIMLSMVAAGSKGKTLDEFLSFLKSKNLDELGKLVYRVVDHLLTDGVGEDAPKLKVGNGIWISQRSRLKEKFAQVVNMVYKGDIKQADFRNKHEEVAEEVNLWAEEKTNGLIKEILPAGSVNPMVRLILANAIRFKGTWMEPFDATYTTDCPFHLPSGIDIEVPFMTNTNLYQYVAQFDGFKVLALPYVDGIYENEDDIRNFSMYIFLPDSNDGLPTLVENLDSGSAFLDQHIPVKHERIGTFLIPKFKISYQFEASEVLKELGVVSAFILLNDLTEMADSPFGEELFVSKIFHKTFIEVDEEGTEAAATTACECDDLSCDGSPETDTIDFVADHPFLFMIREVVTGLVLFVGQILNPLEA